MIRGSLKLSALCSVLAVYESEVEVGVTTALKLNMFGFLKRTKERVSQEKKPASEAAPALHKDKGGRIRTELIPASDDAASSEYQDPLDSVDVPPVPNLTGSAVALPRGAEHNAKLGGSSYDILVTAQQNEASTAQQTNTALDQAAFGLFISGQQTPELQSQLAQFVGAKKYGQDHPSIVVSGCPFNLKSKSYTDGSKFDNEKYIHPDALVVDMPSHEYAMKSIFTDIFQVPGMDETAQSLNMVVPKKGTVSTFVISNKKWSKVNEFVNFVDEFVSEKNENDIDKIAAMRFKTFVQYFGDNLVEISQSINNDDEWNNFIENYSEDESLKFMKSARNGGWRKMLAFDQLLPGIFGFSPEASNILRNTGTWQQYSLRWIAKGLSAYSAIDGAAADVYNLVFAMQRLRRDGGYEIDYRKADADDDSVRLRNAGLPHKWVKKLKGEELIHMFKEFYETLKNASDIANVEHHRAIDDLKKMWVPTHLQQDGEADDSFAWLLLTHIKKIIGGPKLRMLVQLPTSFDENVNATTKALLDFYKNGSASSESTKVFFDNESKNAEALVKSMIKNTNFSEVFSNYSDDSIQNSDLMSNGVNFKVDFNQLL